MILDYLLAQQQRLEDETNYTTELGKFIGEIKKQGAASRQNGNQPHPALLMYGLNSKLNRFALSEY